MLEVPTSLQPPIFRDRDGGLWLATLDAGLMHVHAGRVETFTRADGLSGNAVWGGVFEDHEGNVWVVTRDGLDVFRPQAAVTYSAAQGMSGLSASVLAASDGTVWATSGSALVRLRDGRIDQTWPVGPASLFEDQRARSGWDRARVSLTSTTDH